ncbi:MULTISPECIES: alpha,alpha-trehalase TreH1 [Metallosphaera]|uniref:alpha,alpha-trehalase TreH1 n=1 Tax=Metallosphaera TaxID=41980 RepID=UPI001F06D7F6|nr:alpha,alpha-trehalase TreH1 [Metallosphaera sedula]MCH1770299.1 glycoside hydrolase family 15 protein [Metallosphaera sedula]MCP6727867.1 glycoside hydrolase family 15 protein [Metallosphaera sedula]
MLGFISNQITSAIIDGTSVVWFPVPKFDSPSIFSKLVDERGGEFSIAPGEVTYMAQEYRDPMVLTTYVETDQGKMTIQDLIPIGETIIIRRVESEFPFKVLFNPIFYYGLYRPVPDGNRRINPRGRDCVAFLYEYDGEVEMESDDVWKFSRGKGYLVVNYSSDAKHGPLSERTSRLSLDFSRPFEKTVEYWRRSLPKSRIYLEDLYTTSLAVLLGSIYAPSGGPVASPTTSLPEVIGGSRNWDYRFAWVRDSSIIAESLLDADYVVKARDIINFLLSLINFSSKPFFYPLYTVEGTIPPPERKLPWLSGFRGSRPVRVGNGASTQVQLDVEGFFMATLYKYFEKTGDRVYIYDALERISYLADWEAENWRMKDSGIWEDRGEPQHYIHSKVMMWVAMDRAGKIMNVLGMQDRWKDTREELRSWILEQSGEYFPRYPGSDQVDASILSAPLYDFVDVNDKVFLNTLRRVERDLVKDGFVKRYVSDFMGEAKHPFLLTTLWLARVYIRLGETGKARDILERLDRVSGSLHLLGEHLDTSTLEFTGNFPQVFVHAQVVSALKELERFQ